MRDRARFGCTLVAGVALAAGCGNDTAGGGAQTDTEAGMSTAGPTLGEEDTSTTGEVETGPGASSGSAESSSTGDPQSVAVEIVRDAHGVPHIHAATDEGAFFGLGYASAEDRLVQMHLAVLSAQGRMSEVVGAETISADQKMRVWGVWRHALAAAEALGPEYLGLLTAYADGVNAYLAEHPGELPEALAELGIDAQTWSPAHSLAVWYRLGNFFANDPSDKAAAYEDFLAAVQADGLEAALAELQGSGPGGDPGAAVIKQTDVPTSVQDATLAYAASLGYGAMAAPAPHGYAATAPHNYGHTSPKFSHAWAVSGTHTTTGTAVLVSDPQVPVAAPNLLYEFAIQGETVHARGIGAAGTPGLLIGYTPNLAWGMTAAGLDQRDLFRLEMTDPVHYTVDGDEYEITVETETISVKGGADVDVDYRTSLWGPVVTSTLAGTVRDEYALKGIPFSEPDRDTFVAMVEMMRADDLASFREAIEEWRFPSANIVAALPGGDVFYTVVGAIPVRSVESVVGGMFAQDGGSLAFDWIDTIPGEFKPWVLNPADGYVMSANHRVVEEWYPLPLGVGVGALGDTVRSRRLRELLEALPAETAPQDVLDAVQFDCANAGRRDLIALGHHIRTVDPSALGSAAQATLDRLVSWSAAGGQMLTQSEGVGTAWLVSTKFRVQQTGPELNALYGGGESGLSLFLDAMMASIAADPDFRPSSQTVAYVDILLAAASDDSRGTAVEDDTWFAQTVATQSYDLFAAPDAPVAVGTPYAAPTMQCADGGTVWSQVGETYTQFVDVGAVDDATTIMPPGNREDLSGPWGTSQAEGWISGDYKTAPLSQSAVDAIAEVRVELEYP